MAEIVAAAVLQVIFAKLASEAVKKVVRSQGIHSELEKLKTTLTQIQALLNDASKKEITNESVKLWLDSLRHLAYDIDDVLDDLATEAMHLELNKKSGDVTSKVRKLIPSCCSNFSLMTSLHDKLDKITTELQDLLGENSTLGLIVRDDQRSEDINRRLQTSMQHELGIVGRQGEKEALLPKLLLAEDDPYNQNFSVVPIVGMGGIGKTTLARLLYNEQQVNDHFELKAWVCVSNNFDSFSISKVIFQSVSGENKDFADLNLLQVALRDLLSGKRFLLVLDDVWSESYQDWKILEGPFHACALGSKIIMTTRKEQLLKKMGCDRLNRLQSLLHDDAMTLFAQNVFDLGNYESHPTLKWLGEDIVKKCHGLPLALIAIGRLLRTKAYEEKNWEYVLNNEIWTLPEEVGIVPALRLSYHDLSASLKQLFAYCSLFPKDYMFDKENLIFLWMAEGFLYQSSQNKRKIEWLGHEYFDELLSRSFFQHAPNDKSLYMMHDLMNDLATSISGDFFVRLDKERNNDKRNESLEKYRHMSFVRTKYDAYMKFEAFRRAKSLRTFLATSIEVNGSWREFYLSNKILDDLLPKFPLLRVLCLSGYEISEVPEFVGMLKHLRYLNLSQTKIKHLPENVGNLYNLQTLILFGCHDLIKLPNSFIKLKNLRHFDIRNTPQLNEMPLGLGELKSLQTLSKVIIGDDIRFEITELKGLKDLCGKISIKGLDKVHNEIHAREMNIFHKGFSELELEWSNVFDGSRKEALETKALNELKPCSDSLKQLKVVSFGGTELPNWIGDLSFVHLKHVSIRGCKNCLSLPPLGQLESLKELFFKGLDGVKSVGSELLGSGVAFRSLEILSFEDMKGWEKWSTNCGDVFPCLKELTINDCPNLEVISVEKVPTLRVLNVSKCGDCVLRSLVRIASSVKKLKIASISGFSDDVWGSVIKYVAAVEELRIENCKEIRYLWESQSKACMVLGNLRNLMVWNCDKLVSLAGDEDEEEDNSGMTSLRKLEIWYCKSMECCICSNNIENLTIGYCTSLTTISFPKGGRQKLKSVEIRGCIKLLEKELMGGENSSSSFSGLINSTMLEDVWISEWVNLKSITELNCYLHLTRLQINNCSSLKSFSEHQLSNLTSLIHLTINNCPSMDVSFPSSGLVWPPKLQSLEIGGLKKPLSEWGSHNFPTSFVKLTIYAGYSEKDDVDDISLLFNVLPTSLTCLVLNNFKKLEKVSEGLQHLTSLQHLEIWMCPKLMDLPETLFPSLLNLTIYGSPKLSKRCSRKSGKKSYWPRISHIPKIYMHE